MIENPPLNPQNFYEGDGIFYKDTGCCSVCPSQFWLNTRTDVVDDPFPAAKSTWDKYPGVSVTEASKDFERDMNEFPEGEAKIRLGIARDELEQESEVVVTETENP